jgi:protein O-GlcNAc transferase
VSASRETPAGPERPGSTAAWTEAGIAHFQGGRLAEAEAAMREALRLSPESTVAVANLGAVLRARGRREEALAIYQQALQAAPDAAAVLVNQANLLNELKRWPEALASALHASSKAPGNPGAHNARGNALRNLGRYAEAIVSYREAVRISPSHFGAWLNLGNTLCQAAQPDAALEAYAKALAVGPADARVHLGSGHAFAQLKRWADASAAYDQAYALDPAAHYVRGQRLHARMKICDWRDFDNLVDEIAGQIDAGKPAATPFTIVAAPFSAEQQLRCAQIFANDVLVAPPGPGATPPRDRRIRVGYFSSDLQEHATAHLIAEMLELHDRQAFELTALSYGGQSTAPMRARLVAACERFCEVQSLGTAEICDLARGLGLDLAIDLKGYTTHGRAELFAARLAPVQVSFLGFPMTTGAPSMDYLIADRVLIGPADRRLYSEKVAWLDRCYQPNDRQRPVSARMTSRRDHGLEADAFVFASFNGSYKITPETFDAWMRMLHALPGAVLWLMHDDVDAARNLRTAASAAGVDADRLVFAPLLPFPEHLERIRHADLFVDTFPCSAHTTASDALWVGLPIVTRKGDTFASRVAASLLTAVGLPELATESLAGYRAAALDLARDPERLTAIRGQLAEARTGSPLFDTPAYVRNLEALYRRMHERRLAGLPPGHLP